MTFFDCYVGLSVSLYYFCEGGCVKSLDCGARGPGFESRWRRKCWAV